MATATPRLMGAQVKRKEDPRLVTGTSTYVGDLNIPGLHDVAFVRSPHAHAKVGKIDGSAAARRPVVVRPAPRPRRVRAAAVQRLAGPRP